MNKMTSKTSILVIGAGELGSSILEAFLAHPAYNSNTYNLNLMLRAQSIHSNDPSKRAQYDKFCDRGVKLVEGDIINDDEKSLLRAFKPYQIVIQAGIMTAPTGTSLKVANAIVAAEVPYFMPWQHGVNYDAIGREGGFGLFTEQIQVRELLRAQKTTHWVVVSCGIFMSFLFEQFWGVVDRIGDGKIKVTALNSWEDMITTTTARDIGRCTAEFVLSEKDWPDGPIYIAGDTLTYQEFADVVEKVSGWEVVREVWPLKYLKEEAQKDPDDKLKKYRVVFSEGVGLSWPVEGTWNYQRGLKMENVADWIKDNFN